MAVDTYYIFYYTCAFSRTNVAVTELNVLGVNAGTVTFAFVELTTVYPCKPAPELIVSTVTEPGPAVIAWYPAAAPGFTSVTVSTGVQVPPGVQGDRRQEYKC